MKIQQISNKNMNMIGECYNLTTFDKLGNLVLTGDLFPPCLPLTEIYCVFDKNELVSFFTVFNGFEIPSVVILNSSERIYDFILRNISTFLPKWFVLVSSTLSEGILNKYLTITEKSSEICMTTDLDGARFLVSDPTLIHGTSRELNRINNFYKENDTFPWNPIQLESQFYFFKEDNNHIIACGGTHFETPEVAHLGNILVLPEYRRKSIGTNLVSTIGNKILKTKKRISLFVERENTPAISLYQKLGFSSQKDFTIFSCALD